MRLVVYFNLENLLIDFFLLLQQRLLIIFDVILDLINHAGKSLYLLLSPLEL